MVESTRQQLCPSCSYDLSETSPGECPQCGALFNRIVQIELVGSSRFLRRQLLWLAARPAVFLIGLLLVSLLVTAVTHTSIFFQVLAVFALINTAIFHPVTTSGAMGVIAAFYGLWLAIVMKHWQWVRPLIAQGKDQSRWFRRAVLATLLLGDVGLIIALARIMGGIFSQIPFAFD